MSHLKIFILTASFLSLLVFNISCKAEEQKEVSKKFKDPLIQRVDLIYDSNTGLCPYVALAPNGDLIATWSSRGDIKPGCTASFAISKDLGKTWSKPYLTFKSDNPLIGTQVSLQRLPDSNWGIGLMACTIFESEHESLDSLQNRKFNVFYAISSDNGKTFINKKQINDPNEKADFQQGNFAELKNGDLLWPWGRWHGNSFNGFRRSIDGGLTWQAAKKAWQDPPPGSDKKLVFNETAVAVCSSGKIVSIARNDVLIDKKFWQIESIDNGQTWSAPHQLELAGGSPVMYCTPEGQLWLAYRDGGIGPGLALAVSDDEGQSWRFLYHLKEAKGEHERLYSNIKYTDQDRQKRWRPAEGIAGYPCFEKLSDTEVYIVFHAHNKELLQKFAPGMDPYYVVGNLLKIPQ